MWQIRYKIRRLRLVQFILIFPSHTDYWVWNTQSTLCYKADVLYPQCRHISVAVNYNCFIDWIILVLTIYYQQVVKGCAVMLLWFSFVNYLVIPITGISNRRTPLCHAWIFLFTQSFIMQNNQFRTSEESPAIIWWTVDADSLLHYLS